MTGQVWSLDASGGFFFSFPMSKVLRVALQPKLKFRQLCDARDATSKASKTGDKFYWDQVSDLATQGGTLTETSTVPHTDFTISQGTLTVTEAANGVPWTCKLEELVSPEIEAIVANQLARDCAKYNDIQAWRQFNRTPLRVTPGSSGTATDLLSLSTNGTATATNNIALRFDHVKLISDLMKERNIPPFPNFPNDKYGAIGRPTTFRALKNDLEAVYKYVNEGFDWIVNGMIGRAEDIIFIEQTFITPGGAADTTTHDPATRTGDPWNNAKSDWTFFFGGDTVMEGVVVPEEIRGRIPSDYGRSKGMAWYTLNGYGLARPAAADATILKWDSAV